MGAEHFKQMYADALFVDCRAMQLCLELMTPDPIDSKFDTNFWKSMPTDVIMERARGLVQLGDEYVADMKQLLVEGTTQVFISDGEGHTLNIRDPDVIDFDDPVVQPGAFFHMMMTMPEQLCSGEQNG